MRTRALRPADRAPLAALLRALPEQFTPEEVAIALELIDAGLRTPPSEDYRFLVAEGAGEVLGYACYGPVPLTEGVFDLYWIAVSPRAQGQGIGKRLMGEVEATLAGEGQRMVLVETAGKKAYTATRAFYERIGYREVARIPDFYRVGDDKVIYGKTLGAIR
jgi:ribosomal protein S18 acetylase RimI-like enzyme